MRSTITDGKTSYFTQIQPTKRIEHSKLEDIHHILSLDICLKTVNAKIRLDFLRNATTRLTQFQSHHDIIRDMIDMP